MVRFGCWALAGVAFAAPAGVLAQQDGTMPVVRISAPALGAGSARSSSVLEADVLARQPPGLDPFKQLARVPGLQVSSGDAITGSYSMRLTLRGLNKEQIGISVDGIPNGSTLSNGGTMPHRLLESANLDSIEVSPTAGDLGTPSNQALGGYIDFRTRDPALTRAVYGELSGGSAGYRRAFLRVDSGQSASGLSAYADISRSFQRTWPGEQSGRNLRWHADLRLLQDLGGGSSLRATLSYNRFADNDYDPVALRAISAPFYKATFEGDPSSDGLSDRWTGDPALDQNYRGTHGINSRDILAHIDWTQRFGGSAQLVLKPYLHTQYGYGWFYVPYQQAPADGQAYSAVPPGGAPVASAQECFAGQYRRNADGSLQPLSRAEFPAGASAAMLKALGCPSAAAFAMNPPAQWGARLATTRRSDYRIRRQGVLTEWSMALGDYQQLRVGAWYEHIDRSKSRNWYAVSDPQRNGDFDAARGPYSVTHDRRYLVNTVMAYAQDRLELLSRRLQLSVGATWQRSRESYASPVEFYGTRSLSAASGLLPKVSALYRVDGGWELFASRARNFSAIPDSVFEGTAAISAKRGIQPETSVNSDVGLRWLRGAYGFGITAYAIDYRDRISIQNGKPDADIFSRDATTTFSNQGGIRSRGLELSGQANWRQLELALNYTINRARYAEDTPAEGIRAGDPVLGARRRTGFAEITWKPRRAWRLSVNASYAGAAAGTYGEVPNTVIAGGPAAYSREYMPAYTLVGLALSYRPGAEWGGWCRHCELLLNADNLLNKRYLGGLGSELANSNPLTTGRYFLGSPRALFLTLRSSF
ncbi:TonB-dependent receptor [Massilia sp. BJB1822]|uniref:TonB-dependent receptor n=1 Tax=Massilia sp. BJB1822 TaxID=2744470 RepID=UPI001594C8F6|nr:TonB-dependent receptor [Massilia sp. BJB1822]NVE01670.1 TonB-dependent receptor [Massilia sp. BJB1822]